MGARKKIPINIQTSKDLTFSHEKMLPTMKKKLTTIEMFTRKITQMQKKTWIHPNC